MRERLPVDIENLDLPIDEYKRFDKQNNSYGFANIFYLLGLIITVLSVLTVIFFGK